MPNASTPFFIVELDSPHALDPNVVGSKAASVADLVSSGVTVPAGFSIAASVFAEFIKPAATEIAVALEDVDIESASSSFDASKSILNILESLPTPQGLAEAIAERVPAGTTGLAVRSSATAEDLKGASFAGMYDTFLDATDADSVLRRVREVWSSYYAGRAISYRHRQGIPHESGSMAVLVMELINADAGGVIFTRDPRDGTDHILVNVALGLGEGVVSGEARADSFTLDSKSLEITNRNVVDKEWMFVSGKAGSTDRVPVPANKRSTAALNDSQLLAVAKAASAIKAAAKSDRDIEFAILENTVHILQSRPITTGEKKETEFPVEWDSPEQEKFHWKAGDKKPQLPLVIDYIFMAGKAEKRSVDTVGQYMGRGDLKKIVNGYVFYAETPRDPEVTKATLLKHHLQGRRYLKKGTTYFNEVVKPLLLKNLDELEKIRPADDAPIPEHVAYLRNAMHTGADHMNDLHWRSWAGFDRKDNKKPTAFSEITGKPNVEASNLLLGIEHMSALLAKRLVGMAELVNSDKWLTNIFESRDYRALMARGTGKRPAVRRFRSRFNSMMKVWGCRNGIGYGSAWTPIDPTWDMKPEIPLDAISSYARQDVKAEGRSHKDLRKKRKAAIREVHKIIGRNPKVRKKFDFELFVETNRIQAMENHNYLIEQRTFGAYRESSNRAGIVLVEGGWIDAPDDIFYLRLGQLDDAVDANDYSGLRALVIQAKEDEVENSKLERPDFLGTKPPDEETDKKDKDEPLRGLSKDGETLHGEPASAGSFTGTARVVITRTSTPPDVKKGDVLVAENAGPDWVLIFPLLGALILDSGDFFQHAALIAREYGFPCVIQTKEATTKIADGQVVSVDGTAGTVTLNPLV